MSDTVYEVYEVVITRYPGGRTAVHFPQDDYPHNFETRNHRIYAHQLSCRTVVRLVEFDAEGQLTGNRIFIHAERVVMKKGGH